MNLLDRPDLRDASARAAPALGLVALAIGVVMLIIGASAAVGALWFELSSGALQPARLLPLLPITLWGYALRFVRWHALIRRAVPHLRVWDSFRAQAIGFGLSATPGRLGELWKLYLVERATGARAVTGAGAMAVERLTDLLGFTLLASIGAIAASGGLLQRPSLGVGAAALVLVAGFAARPLIVRRLARTPLRDLVAGSDAVLRPVPVAQALVLQMLGRLGDCILLWGIVAALDYQISLLYAVLVLASSGLIGGISLLPGGIGAVEATSAALLTATGLPPAVGLAAILLTRAFIFWIWIAFGLLLFAHDHVVKGILTARTRRKSCP